MVPTTSEIIYFPISNSGGKSGNFVTLPPVSLALAVNNDSNFRLPTP
jgi:hypothetical protein